MCKYWMVIYNIVFLYIQKSGKKAFKKINLGKLPKFKQKVMNIFQNIFVNTIIH